MVADFHVDRDGARQVDAPALLRPAQLPVAVVVGDDGAGAQPSLQRLAAVAGDLRHRLLQRHLHFGERRDRHVERHRVVEDAVLAQIGVGQHVVADRLRLPQARAMADHQPAMRPQHRDMVGDVLGVGGADADVDQADAAAVRAQRRGRRASGSGARATAAAQRLRFLRRRRRVDHDVAGQHDPLAPRRRASCSRPQRTNWST